MWLRDKFKSKQAEACSTHLPLNLQQLAHGAAENRDAIRILSRAATITSSTGVNAHGMNSPS